MSTVFRLDDAEVIKYPAGELQVRVPESRIAGIQEADKVFLVAQMRSAEDFVKTLLLRNAIGNTAPNAAIYPILPYLPYGRADRQFVKGDCLGVKLLEALLLDTMPMTTLDIHSQAAFNVFAPFVVNVRPEPFIQKAINDFAFRAAVDKINVLFPDEGATKRYDLQRYYGSNAQMVEIAPLFATKKRDAQTGKLSGFEVPDLGGLPTLIVDDICDGGGTFEGIACGYCQTKPSFKHKLPFFGLYTTHGIYSKGLNGLYEWFDVLYTTNSFKEHVSTDRMVVYDCIPMLLKAAEGI